MSGCFAKIVRKDLGVFLTDPGSQIWHWANLRLANGHVKSTSMLSVDVSNGLREELEALALKNKARAIGVALHDLETGFRFSLRGDRWFHAASTIKVAVLLAVFRAADQGRLRLDDSLHVRNRFFSAADGSVFRVSQDRDATPELYAAIGRTAKISALAHAMICREQQSRRQFAARFCGSGICADGSAGSAS